MRHLKNSDVAILLDRRQETGMNASFGETYRAKSNWDEPGARSWNTQAKCAELDGRLAVVEHILRYELRTTWEPIATAPKDGTVILLADDDPDLDPVVGFCESGDWVVRWSHEPFDNPTMWAPLPRRRLVEPLSRA
jgi:hypothetical protein